jgi:hypothetical protein
MVLTNDGMLQVGPVASAVAAAAFRLRCRFSLSSKLLSILLDHQPVDAAPFAEPITGRVDMRMLLSRY